MKKDNFEKIFNKISKYYDERIIKYDDSPKSVGQKNIQTLEKRLSILLQVGDLKKSKILDFGCGTGYLYEYLKKKINYQGVYVGYDISKEMIKLAKKKYKKARFENKDIFQNRIKEKFDYVLINGTFNYKFKNNFDWIKKTLSTLFKKTNKAIAFNNLSSYVDYKDEILYYENPEKIFRFCKSELSPFVTIRHDYQVKTKKMPYEFTTYIYKTKIPIRKLIK
tara:strand:+ start:120 stop:785 length:666 start_codon:yes stop_codon:yes gene_type:complete